MTGVYMFSAALEAKRLGLLRDMVPKATIIAVLIDPTYLTADGQLRDVQEAVSERANQKVEWKTQALTADDPSVRELLQGELTSREVVPARG